MSLIREVALLGLQRTINKFYADNNVKDGFYLVFCKEVTPLVKRHVFINRVLDGTTTDIEAFCWELIRDGKA